MSNIYMDNAATTKVREEVSDSMISVLKITMVIHHLHILMVDLPINY